MKKQSILIGIIGVFLLMQLLGAQTWEKTKRLTWSPGYSNVPAIVVDHNNHIHVVWYDYIPNNCQVYYKRSTNGGITWGSKRLSWTPGDSKSPAIAADTSNNIHVVWSDSTPSKTEIYYKKSTNGGGTWGGVKRLTWNSGYSNYPIVAVSSNFTIHVVWADNTPGNPEIYYRRGGQ